MGWQTTHAPAFQSCPGTALPHAPLPVDLGLPPAGQGTLHFPFFFCFADEYEKHEQDLSLPGHLLLLLIISGQLVAGAVWLWSCSAFPRLAASPLLPGSARGLCPWKPQSIALPAPLPRGQHVTIMQSRNGLYKKKQDVGRFTFKGGVSGSLSNASRLQRELFKFVTHQQWYCGS